MLKRGICLLLALMLLCGAVPAWADNQAMPDYIPVALNVYSGRTDVVEMEGLYRERVLYFPADVICQLTGAAVAESAPDWVTFSLYEGLRKFTVYEDGMIYESYTAKDVKTQSDAVSYEGELYVSAWDILTYMGAVVEFGQDEKADVHLWVHMPYSVLDLYAEGLQNNFHRFGWDEADGKLLDPEDVVGLAALDTILIGNESNIVSYANGSYADHIEKSIYAEVLMEILYANETESIPAEDPGVGLSDALNATVSLPMPWLQKVMDLHAETVGKEMVAQVIGTGLDVAGGLVSMNTAMISALSAMNQYQAMSSTLQGLLRDTLCRVSSGSALYEQLPLLFDAAREMDGIVQGEYTQNEILLEEGLYGLSNIGASLLNSNLAAAAWSTLTGVLSLDYDIEGSLLNDEKSITYASVCSDVCVLSYELLKEDINDLVAANLYLGREDDELLEYIRMDIILCLKASMTARQLLLGTGWLTDEAQAAMEQTVKIQAAMLNRAETAVVTPLGVIEPLEKDIAWVEKLHLLEGLTVVHPLFRLRNGFVKKVERLTEVPAGYIPIYSYEDFKVIADSCPSTTSVTSGYLPLTQANQAKYILMDDIVMPDSYDSAAVFAGVLDGNGYTIKNVSMPLFGRLINATVKNLAMEVDCTYTDGGNHTYYSTYPSDSYYFGCIANNYYYGLGSSNVIDNCSITGTVTLNTYDVQYGAFVGGRGNATITNCYSDVDVNICATYGYVGGIGCFGNSYYNCINEGSISVTFTTDYSTNCVAGIGARYNDAASTCYNSGAISVSFAPGGGGQAAGIIAMQESYSEGTDTVFNCYNIGSVTLSGSAADGEDTIRHYAGGVVGYYRGSDPHIACCWNGGRITGATAGGIIGHAGMGVDLVDCSNLGVITGGQYAGGLMGQTLWESSMTRCVQAGTVSGATAGNLVGSHTVSSTSQITVQDCYAADSGLPLANPALEGASVTMLSLDAMANRDNLSSLDFETLWIIRNHLPIPLSHDRTVVRSIDYSTDFVVPEPVEEEAVQTDAAELSAQPQPEQAAVSGVNTAGAEPAQTAQATATPQPTVPPMSFQKVKMTSGKSYSVYSSSSANSWRGANGKASVSTNGDVWAVGWDNGWLLICYETSNGSVRVGYIDGSKISGSVSVQNQLNFARTPATITRDTTLTDDIIRGATAITTLKAGTEVLYLATWTDDASWAYIETTLQGQTVRAFVPLSAVDVTP